MAELQTREHEAHPGDEYVFIREKVREALEYAL